MKKVVQRLKYREIYGIEGLGNSIIFHSLSFLSRVTTVMDLFEIGDGYFGIYLGGVGLN